MFCRYLKELFPGPIVRHFAIWSFSTSPSQSRLPIQWDVSRVSWMCLIISFLGPRGPLRVPSSVSSLVRPHQNTDQTRKDQTKRDQDRPRHTRPGQIRQGHTRPGQNRTGQTGIDQTRPGQIRKDQDRRDQIRSEKTSILWT